MTVAVEPVPCVKVSVAALTNVEMEVDVVLVMVEVSMANALVRDGEFMLELWLGNAESLLLEEDIEDDIEGKTGEENEGCIKAVGDEPVVAASTIPVPRMLMIELEELVMLEDETIELVVDELVSAASTKLLVELVIESVPLPNRGCNR